MAHRGHQSFFGSKPARTMNVGRGKQRITIEEEFTRDTLERLGKFPLSNQLPILENLISGLQAEKNRLQTNERKIEQSPQPIKKQKEEKLTKSAVGAKPAHSSSSSGSSSNSKRKRDRDEIETFPEKGLKLPKAKYAKLALDVKSFRSTPEEDDLADHDDAITSGMPVDASTAPELNKTPSNQQLHFSDRGRSRSPSP